MTNQAKKTACSCGAEVDEVDDRLSKRMDDFDRRMSAFERQPPERHPEESTH